MTARLPLPVTPSMASAARLFAAPLLVSALLVAVGCSSPDDGGPSTSDAGQADAAAQRTADTQHNADTTPPATSGTFNALTYNIKGLPDAITGWDTSVHMELISPMLAPFDFIAIEEDWIKINHDLLMAKSSHAYKDWFSAKKDSTKGYGAGLTLLTDKTVLAHAHEHYASCLGIVDHASDCLASKGVIFTRIQLSAHPDASVDVYITHMEAGGSAEEDVIRMEQVQHILTMMETHSKGRAVIVTGDTNLRLNDPADKPAILKLNKDGGMVDSCEATSCPEPNHIDRFHFRSGDKLTLTALKWRRETKFVDDKGVDLSDHPAISTQFSWAVK